MCSLLFSVVLQSTLFSTENIRAMRSKTLGSDQSIHHRFSAPSNHHKAQKARNLDPSFEVHNGCASVSMLGQVRLSIRGGSVTPESRKKRKQNRKSGKDFILSDSKPTKISPSLKASGYQGPHNFDAMRRYRIADKHQSQERRPATEDVIPSQSQGRNWLGKKLRQIRKSKDVHGLLSRLKSKAARDFAALHQSTTPENVSTAPILAGIRLQESWPRIKAISDTNVTAGVKTQASLHHVPDSSATGYSLPPPAPRGTGANNSKTQQGRASNWLISAYEKRRAELDAQRAAAATARDERAKAKAAALEERRRWRKRLGARTQRGQPVMQHVVQRLMIQLQRSEKAATTPNAPSPAEAVRESSDSEG